MYNVLISTAIAAALIAIFMALGFSAWASLVPAILALLISNFLLARRIGKKVQALATDAQKDISAAQGSGNPKAAQKSIEKAIKTLESGFQYDKWQFMVKAELHSNIGILHYVVKQFDAAKPHLQQASARGPAGARAKAMLGAIHYRAKDEPAMSAAFEQAVKAGKKEPLIWAAYAWCLSKLDRNDQALRVLARAVAANPSDENLKKSQAALQNDKKMKMNPYGLEWYQFHLENPPMDMGPGGGRRVQFQRR